MKNSVQGCKIQNGSQENSTVAVILVIKTAMRNVHGYGQNVFIGVRKRIDGAVLLYMYRMLFVPCDVL